MRKLVVGTGVGVLAAAVAAGGNRGYKVRYKGGYFPVPPVDHFADIRDAIVKNLEASGLSVERAHHEVGTAGQAEINYVYATMLKAGDNLQKYKYIVKNTAWAAGKTATFMPKPIFGDNGSGMHVHSSLWNEGEPLFYDEAGYGGLSDVARWYIGGILEHAPSLLAFTNPTVNSYHRLVPGFEAPVNLVYSSRNRSAAMRIPITGSNPKTKRVEFRCPDPSSNPYLAFAAILLAGIDGILNKTEPAAPIDKDLYELPPEEHASVQTVPDSLDGVLANLEADHDYLLAGDVFTPDLIETWIELKREDIDAVRLRPHPMSSSSTTTSDPIVRQNPRIHAWIGGFRASRGGSIRSDSARIPQKIRSRCRLLRSGNVRLRGVTHVHA
jgi:glutamine synthetase